MHEVTGSRMLLMSVTRRHLKKLPTAVRDSTRTDVRLTRRKTKRANIVWSRHRRRSLGTTLQRHERALLLTTDQVPLRSSRFPYHRDSPCSECVCVVSRVNAQ